MKIIILTLSLSFISLFAFTQAPEIEWQNTIGGSLYEWALSIDLTYDGGYILAGYSESGISGDKTDSSRGSYDCWIIKLNSLGNIDWQKTIGGENSDQAFDIHQTIDSGYIIAGYSESNISGEKSEMCRGGADYWIIKLNNTGNIIWQKTYGGSEADIPRVIQQTSDGGYIVGGKSTSGNSEDKTTINYGMDDYWVIKLDSLGEIMWQKEFGGDLIDILFSMEQTNDGGYILGGSSKSGMTGNKSEESQGFYDYWILKLDSTGNILWQNTIGGNNEDNFRNVHQTSEGGYILSGISESDLFGDKTEWSMGGEDYWIIKIDSIGQIEWQNTIGGNENDDLFDAIETNSGQFILTGTSLSGVTGDKTEINYGWFDYWIIKLNSTGDLILWQKSLGGSGFEGPYEILQTNDEGYITCGFSESGISPTKDEICQGLNDYWVVKFGSDCSELQEFCNGIDDDCNGVIDDGLTYNIYYFDFDEDGFGNPDSTVIICDAFPPSGYVTDNTDCNDFYALINPTMMEICNSVDDNCNVLIDEDLPTQVLYIDEDEDDYGNVNFDTITCFLAIAGYVDDTTDCDDSNPLIYPGSPEVLDGIDNNCNEVIDEGFNSIENLNNSVISVYPNPAKTILYIKFQNNETAIIEVINTLGKIVARTDKEFPVTEINVEEFSEGIYFLKMNNSEKEFGIKFMKE